MHYKQWTMFLLGAGLMYMSQPLAIASSTGMSVSARIRAVTCTLVLTTDRGEKSLMWRVGVTKQPNGSTQIVGNATSLRRQVTVSFQNPGKQQIDPVTGKPVDCSIVKSGIAIRFSAKDTPIMMGQSQKDPKMGIIPFVGQNSGKPWRYFEYYVTYDPVSMQNAAGENMTLKEPVISGNYLGEKIMPLSGGVADTQLILRFKPNITTVRRLGSYPFYIWLVNNYPDVKTAPEVTETSSAYQSSLTITATYL